LIAAALLLAGCATPKPVMEQANHTVAMTAELQAALHEYDRAQAWVVQARLRSVARQEAALGFVQGQSRVYDTARAISGDPVPAELVQRINTVAGEIADNEKKTREAAAQLDAEFARLLKPIASSDAKLDATQRALAAFGRELSPKARFDEARAFATKVKESVDANREKIRQAEAEAAAAKN
jgi:hypothetical protein